MTIKEEIEAGSWTKCILKEDGTKLFSHEKSFTEAIDSFNKSDKITRNWSILYSSKDK